MLTSIVVITCIIAFLWGANILSEKQDGLAFCAVTFAPIIGLGTLLSSCWQAALAILVLIVFGFIMIGTISALFSGGGGGQLLKVLMVIGACIIALPPFWPIAIPLVVCLVGANLVLAPIGLLASVVRNFLSRD
jgi:hypothetical protein